MKFLARERFSILHLIGGCGFVEIVKSGHWIAAILFLVVYCGACAFALDRMEAA